LLFRAHPGTFAEQRAVNGQDCEEGQLQAAKVRHALRAFLRLHAAGSFSRFSNASNWGRERFGQTSTRIATPDPASRIAEPMLPASALQQNWAIELGFVL
jgi:hypothetical protein